MDERVYWIWLQQVFGPGSSKPAKIHSQYEGGVKAFFQGGSSLWNSRRDLTDKEAAALRYFTLEQAEARLEYALRSGWQVLSYGCREYPELLRNIPDPPAVLYSKGTLPDVDGTLSVSVAGARKALPATVDAARRFGYQLAAGGACVVSGGAKGVDAAVLTGALTFPGARCVSVLPVSLESGYVAENARLRRLITERGGALVTEYFSMERPAYGTFQLRNRLITGLSRGVVLLQAAAKSGTLIYATRGTEQNRDLFVWPGGDGPEFAGSLSLLEDGAKAVLSGDDVLAEYNVLPAEPIESPARRRVREIVVRSPVLRELSPEPNSSAPRAADPAAFLLPQAVQLLEQLSPEPLSVADLEEKTGLTAPVLLSLLTELEVEGLVQSLPGKRYFRRG